MKIELHQIKNISNGFRFYAEINKSYEAWIDISSNGDWIDGTFKSDSVSGKKFYEKAKAYIKSKGL